jgi:hypothetical protein
MPFLFLPSSLLPSALPLPLLLPSALPLPSQLVAAEAVPVDVDVVAEAVPVDADVAVEADPVDSLYGIQKARRLERAEQEGLGYPPRPAWSLAVFGTKGLTWVRGG